MPSSITSTSVDLESKLGTSDKTDGNEAIGLIELTQTHNLEPRDEVDTGQLSVLASLADE